MTNSLLPAHRSGLDRRSAAKPRRRLLQRSSPASNYLTVISSVLFLSVGMVQAGDKAAKPSAIVCAKDGPAQEVLAARELRRYWYLRTGDLLPIVPSMEQQASGGGFVVGRKDRAMLREMDSTPAWSATLAGLGPQQYLLKTIERGGNRWLLIAGGDDVGTLYGAYRVAEHLGVRFYLHGDVIPDERMLAELPNLDEPGKPLFALRGIQPFNNFPFGPDWWTTEDYKATISQLAKMRMNFIGFHCYPEYYGRALGEPTVWAGVKDGFDDQGRVRAGYLTRQSHTMENPAIGGFAVPMRTSDYRFGAAMLFDRDDAGSEAMAAGSSQPTDLDRQNAVFNHCGAMYREAFGYARVLGVKTCVGTELPSKQQGCGLPPAVLERLKAQQKDPADPVVVREIYEAMFQRIMKTHPLDYYWLWTCEGWRSGNTAEDLKVVVEHSNAAHEAIRRVGAPFRLATSGWVLGPQEDRAAYDRLLPKDVAVSSINPELGNNPVEPAYARIQGREKWAIPWMEDDMALADPQLWVGRTRKDAADALAYGCTGLLGIHWRTQIIAPNFAALAQAGWNQSPWNPEPGKVLAPRTLSTADFYADWARSNFGSEVAGEVAAIYGRIDGNLPRVASGCPCGLNPDNRPWDQVAKEYGFVDALQECRNKVKGAGNLARFDYWLNSLYYLRATGHMECAIGRYNQAMTGAQAEKDPTKRKELAKTLVLPAYREVFQQYAEALGRLMQTTSSAGELATVAVWQQTYYPWVIESRAKDLTGALGEPLPADLQATQQYKGPPRLIVPTIRSTVVHGDKPPLRIIVLAEQPPQVARFHWRTMGTGEYAVADFQHVARGVYSINLPPVSAAGIEYYIEATTGDGQRLVFPPTAPQLCQTVTCLSNP